MKYIVSVVLHFSRRPSKKDIVNKLFDILRDNKLKYQIVVKDWKNQFDWKDK